GSAMTTNSQISTDVGIQFTEEMKGYLAVGGTSFEDGYQKGKDEGGDFMFNITIQTNDLNQYLTSEDHQAQAIGYGKGDLVGGQRQVSKGDFNLFVDTADRNRKEMRYRLFFEDAQGQPLTLSGFKSIQNNVGPDVWEDTTTLFTNIYRGHLQANQEASA